MKIVLIEPKSNLNIYSQWAHIPRLGIIILGTILKKAGHEVKIYIEEISKINWDKIYEANVVGISTITATAPKAFEIAKKITMAERKILVILGGSHPTFLPDESLEYADFVVRGEGEEIVLPLIKAIEQGKGFEKINNLSYKMFGKNFHNPFILTGCDLNKLPIPDFSLIDSWDKKKKVTFPIQTTRGCPYNCTFCSVTKIFGHKLRYKTPEKVIKELEWQISEWGAEEFFFVDDNFTAYKKGAKELLKKITEKNLDIKWIAQVRADAAKDEILLMLMRNAGCQMVCIGMESVNPDTLLSAKKSQTIEEVRHAIKKFHQYKMRVHGMFVVGFDTDSLATTKEIVQFAKKEGVDSVQIFPLVPLPGTEIYKEFSKRLLGAGWEKYDGHHVVFNPTQTSSYRLQLAIMKAHAEFYSLWQIMKKLLKRDWFSAGIRMYGRQLAEKWKNQKSVKKYLQKLKFLAVKHK
ncbi:radical SAM protein [bacterium (Candidatus Gribaldobacteria) CG_4_10_14_0_8_um_filter_33_9]|uniref:Radical SAM protein n=1 Tax=bacterium (Candidatus Gribaldobacteria) CG_4_10_14_0_8_um_filter_33_9 TaxID=2014266 RepID=A0A2M7RNF8_9BACT|nr:MAG: radical SAM protein [bacterium (Candidatus Gribaldobacteria) CG_4_10_14_0_8_um_filter_33_9]